MLLQGIFPPITTPFYPDGNVYYKKLEANVERYSKTPVAGMVVLGSTGEAILLCDEERRDVLKTALRGGREQQSHDRRHRYRVGHRNPAPDRIRRRRSATTLPWCALRITTRARCKPANMLAFYRTVCDRSPCLSSSTTSRRPPDTTFPPKSSSNLPGIPNLIGIKESSGDVEKVAEDGGRHAPHQAHRDRNRDFRSGHSAHAEGRRRPRTWRGTGRRIGGHAKPSSVSCERGRAG